MPAAVRAVSTCATVQLFSFPASVNPASGVIFSLKCFNALSNAGFTFSCSLYGAKACKAIPVISILLVLLSIKPNPPSAV